MAGSFGGSVKLRQSQTVLKAGNTFSGKLKPQENFTLGQMLALVSNEQAVRQFEKGWSAILVSSEGKHDDYVNVSNLLALSISISFLSNISLIYIELLGWLVNILSTIIILVFGSILNNSSMSINEIKQCWYKDKT